MLPVQDHHILSHTYDTSILPLTLPLSSWSMISLMNAEVVTKLWLVDGLPHLVNVMHAYLDAARVQEKCMRILMNLGDQSTSHSCHFPNSRTVAEVRHQMRRIGVIDLVLDSMQRNMDNDVIQQKVLQPDDWM